jgi:hypothetical protein
MAYPQAEKLDADACAANVSTACLHVAHAYEAGRGVAADPGRAVFFYERACSVDEAEEGCAKAADAYATGTGVSKDRAKERALRGRACHAGGGSACASLGGGQR